MFGSLGDSSIQHSLGINSLLGIWAKAPELCFLLCSPGHERPAADRVFPGGGQREGLLQRPGQGLLQNWWVLGMLRTNRGAGRDPSFLHGSLCLSHQRVWNSGSKAQEGIQALFGICFRFVLAINVEPREVFILEDQPKLCSTHRVLQLPLESPVDSPGNPGFPSSPFSPAVGHSSLTRTPAFLHILAISRETLKCPRTPQWTEGINPIPH